MKDSTHWHEGDSLSIEQQPDGSWKPAEPEKYSPSFLWKFLCFIGYHRWSWRAETKEINGQRTLIIDDEIPDRATCQFCHTPYKK